MKIYVKFYIIIKIWRFLDLELGNLRQNNGPG